MTEEATSPVDGDAMPEVVDALASGNEDLNPQADNQEFDDDGLEGEEGEGDENAEPADALEEVEFEGKTFSVPKEIKEGLLRQADYTRKTQEVAEVRKAVEARQATVEKTEQLQAAFAQDIAQLGALNDRLAPYENVKDWPTYLRTGGAEAQAHYAEMQALKGERDAFAQGLGQKVQQRTLEEQRETARLVEEGRAELAKHIKDYGPDKLNGLLKFAEERLGYSSQELQDAEADPRQIRALHLAQIGAQALQAQKKTQQQAQGQQTRPAPTLRGGSGGGKAPESMSPSDMAKFLGY